MQLGQPLPEALLACAVHDAAGERTLGELIEGPVLLALLRQFGCVGCNAFVTELAPRLLELHELGVATVFVGLGTVPQLEGFVERMALEDKQVRVVTDPSGATHGAAGLERSAWGSFSPTSWGQRLRLAGQGLLSGPVHGDPIRMSGLGFVDGTLRTWHVSRSIADNPPVADLVDEALRLAFARVSA